MTDQCMNKVDKKLEKDCFVAYSFTVPCVIMVGWQACRRIFPAFLRFFRPGFDSPVVLRANV